MRFTLAFQNIDTDGLPTLGGDIVGTVESPKIKHALRARIVSFSRRKGVYWRWAFPDENYRLALGWLSDVFTHEGTSHIVPVHGAGRRPPTPRRDFLVVPGSLLRQWPTTLIVGHAVNSAWAPRWKPTTWRKRRRSLWWAWWNTLLPILERHHKAGRVVILMVDGNRPGKWAPPGMVEVAGDGPQRIFITEAHRSNLRAVATMRGPHTGDGRVTHPSERVVFEVDRWRPGRVSP